MSFLLEGEVMFTAKMQIVEEKDRLLRAILPVAIGLFIAFKDPPFTKIERN